MPRSVRPISLLLVAAAAGLAASCGGPAARVDGSLAEWSADSAGRADGSFVTLRFKVPGAVQSLQAADRPVALLIDADASPATGRVNPRWKAPLNALGFDAEVVFSPTPAGTATEKAPPRRGVVAHRLGADGDVRNIPLEKTGLVFSPTYASDWYEMRIDRAMLEPLTHEGRLIAMFATLGADGKVTGYADPFEVVLPPWAGPPAPATVDVPATPPGAVRVVSYNVEKSRPVADPEPFARILTLLDPDIVLVQEWDEGDAAALEAWFRQHAPGLGSGWKARKTEGSGTAVVSRLPLTAVEPDSLWMSEGGDKPRLVRVAAATVQAPGGPLSLASLHLKCCGGSSGREETLRRAEAQAIRGMLVGAGAHGLLVAGDFNLVGTRQPLDTLRAGLDHGVDLAVVEPVALGGDLSITWRDWSAGFTPGRLDYALASASTVRVVRSFILDTALLSDESLARMGLDRADGAASDHLPVVMDVVVTK
jgi:endonuclease/exonuclease/phosphatase family metal-dependent hydrolase